MILLICCLQCNAMVMTLFQICCFQTTFSISLSKHQSVSESVCLFVPYLLRNDEPEGAEILRDDSPWDGECFRLPDLSNHQQKKIACIVGMYTSDPGGQFYSLLYESSTYLGGQQGVGRLISDRMSYRNHYMCSGEATGES